jgi:hypothetical protein
MGRGYDVWIGPILFYEDHLEMPLTTSETRAKPNYNICLDLLSHEKFIPLLFHA